jgi:hypothetical protein
MPAKKSFRTVLRLYFDCIKSGVSIQFLTHIARRAKPEKKSFRTVLEPYFDRRKSGVLIRCGLHIARRRTVEKGSIFYRPSPALSPSQKWGFYDGAARTRP